MEGGIRQGPIEDIHVPHEEAVDTEIDSELEDLSDQGTISDVAARTTHATINDAAAVGSSYSQAEVNALRTEIVALNAANSVNEAMLDSMRTKLNQVLGVLRDSGLIPSA